MSKHKSRREEVAVEEVQPVGTTPELVVESVPEPVVIPIPEPPKPKEITTGWKSRDFDCRAEVVSFFNALSVDGYAVEIKYLHKTSGGMYSCIFIVSKVLA